MRQMRLCETVLSYIGDAIIVITDCRQMRSELFFRINPCQLSHGRNAILGGSSKVTASYQGFQLRKARNVREEQFVSSDGSLTFSRFSRISWFIFPPS